MEKEKGENGGKEDVGVKGGGGEESFQFITFLQLEG